MLIGSFQGGEGGGIFTKTQRSSFTRRQIWIARCPFLTANPHVSVRFAREPRRIALNAVHARRRPQVALLDERTPSSFSP